MRKECIFEFTREEFLKRLGFLEDDILVDVFVWQFMEDERKIKVRINRNFPEKKAKP